jgi:hypothetical protein
MKLRHLAGGLMGASVGTGLLAICVRAVWGGSSARALGGATVFFAAVAYLAHVVAHHDDRRELMTRSILFSALRFGGSRRSRPDRRITRQLNDVVIVLFVVDLAILVSPVTKRRPSTHTASVNVSRMKHRS